MALGSHRGSADASASRGAKLERGGSGGVADPVAKLMEDHRVFLQRVQSFRDDLRATRTNLDLGRSLPRRVADFATFLARDVDQIHGQQEERGLFPVLGRYIPIDGGPIGVMLNEHEVLRGFKNDLERSGRKLEADSESEESKRAIWGVSNSIQDLLATHVMKEDTILFPMAYQVLSPEEIREIAQVFEEVESVYGSTACD